MGAEGKVNIDKIKSVQIRSLKLFAPTVVHTNSAFSLFHHYGILYFNSLWLRSSYTIFFINISSFACNSCIAARLCRSKPVTYNHGTLFILTSNLNLPPLRISKCFQSFLYQFIMNRWINFPKILKYLWTCLNEKKIIYLVYLSYCVIVDIKFILYRHLPNISVLSNIYIYIYIYIYSIVLLNILSLYSSFF